MAKFKVGDRVRPSIASDIDPAYLKMVGEVVEVVPGGFYVRFPDGKILDFYARELTLVESTKSLPATATKAMELRAKYKAAPSKRDMVLIGEWNASHSGAGSFYAPRDRRSQVERTFLALEEGDESKEAFDSVVRAGGVFIRD